MFLSAIVSKVFDEFATRTFGIVLRSIMNKRAESAREIALEEIRSGNGNIVLNSLDQDEAVAILWRYLRAAEEGAARINLRLMASIMAGNKTAPFIHADEFLIWSDLLTSLTKTEIVLLANLHKECSALDWSQRDEVTRKAMIPQYFQTEHEFEIAAFALIRTGLIVQIAISGWDGPEGRLGGVFKTSPRMTKLARLADFEGALSREANVP